MKRESNLLSMLSLFFRKKKSFQKLQPNKQTLHNPLSVVMIVGKLPKSQANPLQLESYMAQERGKRRELLQKFLDMCSASQVQPILSFYLIHVSVRLGEFKY